MSENTTSRFELFRQRIISYCSENGAALEFCDGLETALQWALTAGLDKLVEPQAEEGEA